MKLALAAKGGVAPRAIDRNANEFSAEASKLRKQFIVERHLIAANRTPVGWIKGEHDWSPAKLRQADELVGRAAQGEFWSAAASPQRRYCVFLRVHGWFAVYSFLNQLRRGAET